MVRVVITCMCNAVLYVAVGMSCEVIEGKFLSHDKILSTKYFLLCPPPAQHLDNNIFYTSAEINSLKMNFHNPNLGENLKPSALQMATFASSKKRIFLIVVQCLVSATSN